MSASYPGHAGESLDDLFETTCEAARRAGKVLRDRFGGEREISYKGGIDLVTDADGASEELLVAFLNERHPTHEILSEESGYIAAPSSETTRAGDAGGTGRRRWILDPLDGTTNYAHRIPHFCVSVAVEGPPPGPGQAPDLLAGAVYHPLQDELFAAAKGRGATLNGQPLRVSEETKLERALLCTGFPYDVREKPSAPLGLFGRLLTRARGVRRMGAAALDLSYVAAGRFDGFFEYGLKAWDIAAGALIIQEAGGRVTRIDGAPLDLAQGDILAGSAALYPTIQREVGSFLKEIAWRPREGGAPARMFD